jgi:hypothetical protein
MIESAGFHAKYGWANLEYDREILETMLSISTKDNLKELATNLIDAIQPPEYKREEIQSQIVRHANSVDGQASLRVVALLRELVESRTAVSESEAEEFDDSRRGFYLSESK